ncbi:hypothetical protein [Halapricum hydrolyticum]|uniref:Uncharacterized protein n=1 Tax=Halapricum hydrolyticum TaxID=2979991 RepID=A0AAE3IDE8_9EURY|nr:hypothetical protein [Halapricum hydrolyticum]MCU4718901.1 hypothetical protein [Halapricum hydrolyticum]MCU4728006.1 hypothetical protein [Halapricum hydrolyticum]
MVSQPTAEIFSAFVYGVAAMIGGGILFEGGKRYVKTAGSNLFKGKIEALPFFFSVLVLGWILKYLDPAVSVFVYSIPVLQRLGIMVLGTMLLFNYSVDNFRYTDPKSIAVYAVGVALVLSPTFG